MEALGKISSFDLPGRPFFSIVIPCYNSKKTIGNLLQSIVDQNMKDEIEVIISDDCSTEDYLDELLKFKDKVYMILTQTDYNFAPGNTREKGVQSATGEWLCFADHDDLYIKGTLLKVKRILKTSGEKYLGIANFYESRLKDDGSIEILKTMIQSRNWNHAKFYNMDNLWKPYNIHFKKDLLTHEDIYVSSQVNGILAKINGDKPLNIDLFCYHWICRPTTISRQKYGNHNFLEVFFKDYLDSTGYAFLDLLKEDKVPINYAMDACIGVVLLSYIYVQSFLFEHPKDYYRENLDYCTEYLIAVKETFGINNQFIYNYAAANRAAVYETQRASGLIATGFFLPNKTLIDWLDYLHHDIEVKHTMSDSIWKDDKIEN